MVGYLAFVGIFCEVIEFYIPDRINSKGIVFDES